ncbi:hypothetical protein HY988_01595 [Candidatus Micrarchaeota archaeon]|nr:hypothetical protein [Candidatus Micrarchaeota archaeon]
MKNALGIKQKPIEYALFRDPIGRFAIPYPLGWKFDPDILVVDGEYCVSFQSPNGQGLFSITANGSLDKKFNFESYVKTEFIGPHSGMHGELKKEKFKETTCYRKEYIYESEGRKYFGGEKVFVKDHVLYLLTYHALENKKAEMTKIFEYLMNNLIIRTRK